jgi:hypothetical protein
MLNHYRESLGFQQYIDPICFFLLPVVCQASCHFISSPGALRGFSWKLNSFQFQKPLTEKAIAAINIEEMISLLEQKIFWQQVKVTE